MKKLIIFIILTLVLTGCRHGIYSGFIPETKRQADANLLDQQLESERQRLDIPQEMWSDYVSNFKQRKCYGWEYQWGKNWRYWGIKDAEQYFKDYIERQRLISRIKEENPDNWQETLLDQDIEIIQKEGKSSIANAQTLSRIERDKNLLLEHGNHLKQNYDKLNSEYANFLSQLTDEQLEAYQKLITEIKLDRLENAELLKRKIQAILTAEQWAELVSFVNCQLKLNHQTQKLFAVAQQVDAEELRVRQAIAIQAEQQRQAIQAFGKGLKETGEQQMKWYQQQKEWVQRENQPLELNRISRSLQSIDRKLGY